MELEQASYSKVLTNIKQTIAQAQNSVNRQKVLMSWQIGKIIEDYLVSDDRAQYGSRLFSQLEQDIEIPIFTLYKMRTFYKTYPDLKEEDIFLNWSHYRSLINLKTEEERQYFENLAITHKLSSDNLRVEISKNNVATKEAKKTKTLHPRQGLPFHYKLVTLDDSNKQFIDCGFKIFTEITTNLEAPLIVASHKEANGKVTLSPSDTPSSQIYTYKAYLTKVVDGDTLRVTLDLGFGIRHKEIVRLKGINAAEMSSVEGQKSKEALEAILSGVGFLIVKTNQIDRYGRYVADVLFDDAQDDVNEVAANGVYLNQLLLDRNLAVSV